MLSVDQNRLRIWLAQHKVDFRKGHSGLIAEAYKMGLDPYAGDVVIFIGRTRRRLKVLYADQTGVWISSKLFPGSADWRWQIAQKQYPPWVSGAHRFHQFGEARVFSTAKQMT